jgi:drug/metabolite transporter (DMT)-like permease
LTTAKFAYLDGSNLLTLLEPAAAACGSWVLFGETCTPLQWCGFFIALGALFSFEKLSRAEP